METLNENIEYIIKRSHRLDAMHQLFLNEETVQEGLRRVEAKLATFGTIAAQIVSTTGTVFVA